MKNKKKFLLMGVAILSLVLSGCNFKPGGTSSTTSSDNSSGSERAEYTITFDSQGGSPVASIKVKEGEAADEPTAPTKEDNIFTGWYKEVGLYTLYDFNAPVFSDLTLYAGWRDLEYTVTFDTQGGSSVAPITVKKGTIINQPVNPIKSHSSFTGWYKEHELTHQFDFSSPITQDITLYAGWQESTYNLNLKIAVFADIQLCARENGSGYVANAGNTVHAYVALKNHFKLCKEQNVDVILMNGDIVNNAIEEYYLLFKSAFESVYGTDPDQYPEIIYNMGNHEWWDGSEHVTAEAVTLFKQYAMMGEPTKTTAVTFSEKPAETLPTYYRVINGVPFLVISGENPNGYIGNDMKSEIQGWLQEISSLPSVQNGGPIYVAYHCALHTTLTHGNGAFADSLVLEELLASYPQAIVFTGDTHYSGVNERAINQVNFTCINIGSSSYSRMDKMSATMSGSEHFYNMKIKGGKTSDELLGDASYMHEYTPTIHIMNAYNDNDVSIDRYFSTSDEERPIHINKTWDIPHFRDKYYYQYTNKRFENTNAAKELYGAEGVSWSNTANVRFGVKDGKMTVIIPDTNEYHYTEHYKIDVTGNTTKTYDVVNSYYLYHSQPQKMYFFLEDLPAGSNYSIKVTAYDYFDNPSLNQLSSSVNDPNICADEKDNQFTNTYYELSSHLNFEEHALDSDGKTSLEYYYSGVKRNEWGAPLGQLIRDVVPGKTTGGNNISEYLSIGNTDHCEVILKAKIKNLMNTPIKVGYTLYGADYVYKNAQIQSTGKVVNANTGWNSLEWNITSLFPEIVGRESVTFLALIVSADGYGYNAEGYEMHLLLDDMDVVAGEYANIPETATRYNIEMAKFDNSLYRGNGSTGHMTFTETYGSTSTSAMKVTFENSAGLPTAEENTSTKTNTVRAGFDLAQSPITSNKTNYIDAKNCILSFDIKMSSEFFNSISSYKHMFTLQLEDETWVGFSAWLELASPDNYSYEKSDNGWIHVEVDLQGKTQFAGMGEHTFVMTFGFFGIDQTTQQTAYIVLDNIAMTAKS